MQLSHDCCKESLSRENAGDSFSPAEIEEEVMVLHDAHSLLSQCMEAQTTGHPTWEREYECLLTLQGLQDTASQCLHKLQRLHAVIYRECVTFDVTSVIPEHITKDENDLSVSTLLTDAAKHHRNTSKILEEQMELADFICTSTPFCKPSHPSSYRVPEGATPVRLHSQRWSLPCRVRTPLRGRRCGDTGALATPLLYYSSVQELMEMTSLKLQMAMLRQQIDILKVLIAELLPIVESRLPQEDSPSHLYRTVYTQLCEGGERFPVLVNDELPD